MTFSTPYLAPARAAAKLYNEYPKLGPLEVADHAREYERSHRSANVLGGLLEAVFRGAYYGAKALASQEGKN